MHPLRSNVGNTDAPPSHLDRHAGGSRSWRALALRSGRDNSRIAPPCPGGACYATGEPTATHRSFKSGHPPGVRPMHPERALPPAPAANAVAVSPSAENVSTTIRPTAQGTCYASALIAAGVDSVWASRRLCRGSPPVALSVCAHLFAQGHQRSPCFRPRNSAGQDGWVQKADWQSQRALVCRGFV